MQTTALTAFSFRRLSATIIVAAAFCVRPAALLAQQATAQNALHYTIHKKAIASHGCVASAHPLASAVGVQIMRKGGNAFDAAIAVQLALAVVYPGAGNIGGGGFMVARTSAGKLLALDYRETAPGAASRDMYLDSTGKVAAGKSLNGHLSGGVPGTVAGLFRTMRYARLSFEELIQPAIDLAQSGFAITEKQAASLNDIQADLLCYNTMPNAFMRDHWQAGDILRQPELAETLVRIRDRGAKGFYKGRTARLIIAEMRRRGGMITAKDLKAYRAVWRRPLSFTYKGHTIVSMPMPSSGGTLLLQMMKMAEGGSLGSYAFNSPEAVQLMTEAERRAYADRAEYMGDPDFVNVPLKRLTSPEYLMSRMADYRPGIAGNSIDIKPGRLPAKESEETTHISIWDEAGNMVSITTTLNNSYGSKTVIGGAGFLLNDEMDDFSAAPGVPNMYGAVGGAANAIAPGKRMLSSMTPTIVLKDGRPFLVVGSPGGTTIPTSVFQTIVDIIDFRMSTSDAVNRPKFHHQWLPDRIDVEPDFPAATRKRLEGMGYTVHERGPIGRVEAIRILDSGGAEAVADVRGDDDAAGW